MVVYLPLWKIWKSVGIIIPNIWKNKINVLNHQPDIASDHLAMEHGHRSDCRSMRVYNEFRPAGGDPWGISGPNPLVNIQKAK